MKYAVQGAEIAEVFYFSHYVPLFTGAISIEVSENAIWSQVVKELESLHLVRVDILLITTLT